VDAYTKEIHKTLQLMTNQLGTALQSAWMIRRLEELAATESSPECSIIACLRRNFPDQSAPSSVLRNETSIILYDVDHFKAVDGSMVS
jgi:hypothetical protein